MRSPRGRAGESGVTIGIGYDLGYTSKAQIEADWAPFLEQPARASLAAVQGVKGLAAQQLARGIAHLRIPLAAAEAVFHASTLPRFAKLTRDVFPGVEKLPLDAQGALLSLVFNRGASLEGERRREMRAIRDALKGGATARGNRRAGRSHATPVADHARVARTSCERGRAHPRRAQAVRIFRTRRRLTSGCRCSDDSDSSAGPL